ncbi:MAG: transketolase [Melioribacteraceae bacterium]|nr:transketolase [Melioribacteraceae bacterium]
MSDLDIKHLEEASLRVREDVIRMSVNGGCFLGASLSCTDLIVYLYKNFLNINPENLKDPKRDYFFLSKGHDVPALYAALAEVGILERSRLKNHLKENDNIYWHPNRKVPGIEFHSGSLGHLLSVAAGVAYDCKVKQLNNKIIVIVGDGELNEGSNWEALLVANSYKLDNLIVIVDRNEFQANMMTEDLLPLNPLDKKFEAFGCEVKNIDGHMFEDIDYALNKLPYSKDKVSVLIANTVRGKGLPSIEKRADRWFCNFSEDEINSLLNELHTRIKSNLTSEKLFVR